MATKRTKPTKGNKITIDMTGVEAGGLIAEGDYGVRVTKVEHGMSEASGKPKLSWELEITDEGKGGKLYYTTSLQPQALFNLKNLLLCLGVGVPGGKLVLDLDDLVDRECGVTVGHEIYDGKKKSRITDIWPLEDDEDEGEDDEEEEEEEEEDDEDDEDDEDEDGPDYEALTKVDLKALCRERKIKVSKTDDKTALIAKLEAADEEDDI